jgi:hypothetical protein
MSQLTITISDKADALIAQLQKEIFNRRRKKVSAEGVVETLLESGAKSQSDKRFATSWLNLIADIERAASIAQAHGSKPSSLSDEEWALVLSHRTRSTAAAPAKAIKPRSATRAKAAAPAKAKRRTAAAAATAASDDALDLASTTTKPRSARGAAKAKPLGRAKAKSTSAAKPKTTSVAQSGSTGRSRSAAAAASAAAEPAKSTTRTSSRKAAATTGRSSRSSVARRMAKAASRLVVSAPSASGAPIQPSTPALPANGSNGTEAMVNA